MVSQALRLGTAHLNVEPNADERADLYTGVLLEGPYKWTVRPVAEFGEKVGQFHTISRTHRSDIANAG